MSETEPGLLMALTGLLIFIATWIAVMSLIARMGNWTKLADKYAYDGTFTPPKWHNFVSGRFGNARYNGCLCVGISSSGLHIKPAGWLMMGPFHKAFRIPWSSIKSIEERKEWANTHIIFHLSDEPLSFSLLKGNYLEEVKNLLPPSSINLIEQKREYR